MLLVWVLCHHSSVHLEVFGVVNLANRGKEIIGEHRLMLLQHKHEVITSKHQK